MCMTKLSMYIYRIAAIIIVSKYYIFSSSQLQHVHQFPAVKIGWFTPAHALHNALHSSI